jgi:DnaJ-class molecular chaperone
MIFYIKIKKLKKLASEAFGDKIMKKKCAFCKGSGIDPFQLMSKDSVCQVCCGKGKVQINEPAIKCVYCEGTGIYPHSRLSCTVCGGKGMVSVKKGKLTKCSDCDGTGRVFNSDLPCLTCGGKGVL